MHVCSILSNIGVLAIPSQVAVFRANDAFDESGQIRDVGMAKRIGGVASQLIETTNKLAAD